jgi:hypothetical protein
VITLAGTGVAGFKDGECGQAQFFNPYGIAVARGVVFVADLSNHRLRMINGHSPPPFFLMY